MLERSWQTLKGRAPRRTAAPCVWRRAAAPRRDPGRGPHRRRDHQPHRGRRRGGRHSQVPAGEDEDRDNNAREIRSAVERWRATRGGDTARPSRSWCSDKEIDTASKIDDPWGSQLQDHLRGRRGRSSPRLGRDKKEGTADDISVPAKAVTH